MNQLQLQVALNQVSKFYSFLFNSGLEQLTAEKYTCTNELHFTDNDKFDYKEEEFAVFSKYKSVKEKKSNKEGGFEFSVVHNTPL